MAIAVKECIKLHHKLANLMNRRLLPFPMKSFNYLFAIVKADSGRVCFIATPIEFIKLVCNKETRRLKESSVG